MITTLYTTALLAAGWTPLFDGKTLEGWHQVGGQASYQVRDGAIVGRTLKGTPNTFLCTNREYGDFELEFDVMVDPELNSGVQIRSNSVPGYQNGRVHGYQVEIDPSSRAWSGGLYDESRRGWLQNPEKNPIAQKAFRNGQWNHYRISAIGDHFQTWVNGTKVTDLHDKLTQRGFIALQVHSHGKSGVPVRWRNLKIRDLGVPGMEAPRGAKWLLRGPEDIKNWVLENKPDAPATWEWVEDGLEVKPGAGNILSKALLGDFRMHVEFKTDENGRPGQENGNSGVYLLQSYEIQVLNSAPRGPINNECGAVYLQKAPDYAMARSAGTWQTYDIDFTSPKWKDGKKVENARLTLYHNGTMVHDNFEIKEQTGYGVEENPLPRPLRLQDHGNRVRFRNIWLLPR